MNLRCRVVVGALLAGIASVTPADSFVSANLTSINVTLVDLDPTDTITPWITFQDNTSLLYGSVFVSVNHALVDGSYIELATAFLPFSRQASSDGVFASASFAVDATGMGGALAAESHAIFGKSYRDATALAPAVRNQFTISDKTLLYVTATSVVSAEVTHAWASSSVDREMAVASNRIHVWGPAAGGTGSGTQESDAVHRVRAESNMVWDPATELTYFSPVSRSGTQTLSASFVNLSGSELSGTFGISSYASSSTPVPEPHSAWLLLAGLGAGAALRHRRK